MTIRLKPMGLASEQRVVKSLGGQVTIGSGAFRQKGDGLISGVDEKYLLEAKCTSKKSYSLKLEELEKISKEASLTGKIPLLSFSFTHDNGKDKLHGDWVAVPLWFFKENIK